LFVGGLVLTLVGLPLMCWFVGIPMVIGGIVMMVVGGKSPAAAAPQQNYQQVYYPAQGAPQQQALPQQPVYPPYQQYRQEPGHRNEGWRPPPDFP
jgi:hypothetical protein